MIRYQQSNSLVDICLAGTMLKGMEHFYPDFNYWFTNKCMPGIIAGSDILLLAKEHEQVIGIALGKANKKETKLRCVRVIPEYQSKGTGIILIEKMLRNLDCDKPHCTVSEEMIHQFSRPFINLFNFDLTKVNKGMYRKGKLEYIFNLNKET
jgi:hypothetical protein